MCNYFSCIIDRNLKVCWDETTIEHEKIIKKSGWKDDKLQDRDFVRIEITPKNKYKISRSKDDWQYKVDEEDSLPEWYIHNEEKSIDKCWGAWEQSIKINTLIETETTTTNCRYILAFDSAKVKAFDSAQVEAFGSAQVEALGSAKVKAFDSAQVKASGSAQVEAFDSAQVKAFGSAQVKALGSAQVKAFGSAQVEAFGSAQVEASGSAKVKALGSAKVKALGSAKVEAFGSAKVEAFGSAQVEAFDSAKVKVFGSAQVLSKSKGKITLYSDAAVITNYFKNEIIVTKEAKIKRIKKEAEGAKL